MKNISKIVFANFVLILLVLSLLSGCTNSVNDAVANYTVTFNSNGGSKIESVVLEEGEILTKPKTPEKTGFEFIEWQYNEKKFDFSTPIKEDITLIAIFKVNKGIEIINVAFDADNAAVVQTVKIAKDSLVSEPNNPKKDGYIFDGWYNKDIKYDFSNKVKENIVLKAKWKKDTTVKIKDNSKNINTSKNNLINDNFNNNSNDYNSEIESEKDPMIKFSEVKGKWYLEGCNDITIDFYIHEVNWVTIFGTNFNVEKNCIEYYGGGYSEFLDGEYFYFPGATIENLNKLILNKNGKKTIFYRKPDYPKHIETEAEKILKSINKYYWYLDGYKYSYIYPYVHDWFDHKALSWKSENVDIKNNKFYSYENYKYSDYVEIYGPDNVHNELMVNPVDSFIRLITKYNIKVKNNKLYMTIGGEQHTFTKHTSRKKVDIKLSVDKKSITANVEELININVKESPFYEADLIKITSSNSSVVNPLSDIGGHEDGNIKVSLLAIKPGSATITITEIKSGVTISVPVTVKSKNISVTGISLNKTKLDITKGSTEKLSANIIPSNATNENINWTTSNSKVATVTSSGKVIAVGFGNAIITAKTLDGSYTATCNVDVKQKPLTVNASVGISIRSTSSGMTKGIFAEIKPSGGSENYTNYSIKLYYNDVLISESTKKEVFVASVRNGTYKAEVYVRDSDGNEATNTTVSTITVS